MYRLAIVLCACLFSSYLYADGGMLDKNAYIVGIHRGLISQASICSRRYPDYRDAINSSINLWVEKYEVIVKKAYIDFIENSKGSDDPKKYFSENLKRINSVELSMSIDAFESQDALKGLCQQLAAKDSLIKGPFSDLMNSRINDPK